MSKLEFKSLKNQLIISFVALMAIVCIGISLIAIYISKTAVTQTVNTTLPAVAKESAFAIECGIEIKRVHFYNTKKNFTKNIFIESHN